MEKLTIDQLKAEVRYFMQELSATPVPFLYGVTDGRAVGTYQEVQQLQRQLDIERRFHTDHEVRGFQNWLRRQLLLQDVDFFKRFLPLVKSVSWVRGFFQVHC